MSGEKSACPDHPDCCAYQELVKNVGEINSKLTGITTILQAFCSSWQNVLSTEMNIGTGTNADIVDQELVPEGSADPPRKRQRKNKPEGSNRTSEVVAEKKRIKSQPKKLKFSSHEDSPTDDDVTVTRGSSVTSFLDAPSLVRSADGDIPKEEDFSVALHNMLKDEAQEILNARAERGRDSDREGSETSGNTSRSFLESLNLVPADSLSPKSKDGEEKRNPTPRKRIKNTFFTQETKKRGTPLKKPTAMELRKEILLFPGKAVSANVLTRFGPTGTLRRLGYFNTDQAKFEIENLSREGLLSLVITEDLPDALDLPSAAKRNVFRKLPLESDRLSGLLEKYGISLDRYTVAYHAESCGELKFLNDFL